MDSKAWIIQELASKVGLQSEIDFMNLWQGVPLVYKGRLQEAKPESIVFSVQAPEAICLSWETHTHLLHDIIMSGIHARVLAYEPLTGRVELSDFHYADRGFGERVMVRVEPAEPLEARLQLVNGQTYAAQVLDLSLNGFGLQVAASLAPLAVQDELLLQFTLLDQELEISCRLIDNFPHDNHLRLAVCFAPDAPGHDVVTRYISRRRAEIRREIQATYQQAIQGKG